MSEPFLSEIKMCAFNFAPTGWATCDGQVMQIQQNQALFALIGKTYGGNGTTTFQLPDLRGRTPLHMSSAYPIGTYAGSETVTLTATQVPSHTHAMMADTTTTGTTAAPTANSVFSVSDSTYPIYTDAVNLTQLNPATLSSVGGAGHNNVQPTLVINFVIALSGIWPSRD